jgi:16S rRNA pseudouridine516 synthase
LWEERSWQAARWQWERNRRSNLPDVKLAKYIANLGYGSRRQVIAMIDDRRVTTSDGIPLEIGDSFEHAHVLVDGEPLDPPPGSVLMMNKPVGHVCSTKGSSRLIYDLLPDRFRVRSPAMSPVGRLDGDTSGLLLLTDDGQINHRITSPRTHLPKTYDARLANALRGDEAELFATGTLMLDSEETPLEPANLEILDPRFVRLTITEGRYHQVRRMFAAVGNYVDGLHRSRIGGLGLGDLEEGKWRTLRADELAVLFNPMSSSQKEP